MRTDISLTTAAPKKISAIAKFMADVNEKKNEIQKKRGKGNFERNRVSMEEYNQFRLWAWRI